MVLQAWQLIVVVLAGWLNRQQQDVVAYLREKNHVLREQLGGMRIWFTDGQRRRLAGKGKALSRKALGEVCTRVTPETVLGWYRMLIARKYDGGAKRGVGRPPVRQSWPDSVRSAVMCTIFLAHYTIRFSGRARSARSRRCRCTTTPRRFAAPVIRA